MAQKKTLIVGGGYVWFEFTKALETLAGVTLIEQREAFVQPPAAIRALPQHDSLDQIILPYDCLLTHGRGVRGRQTAVSQSEVTLEDGTLLLADHIIPGTGSSYATPFKPAGDSIDDLQKTHADVSTSVSPAKSIVIVGAGAVGPELAGEITATKPGKDITLVSSEDTLFPMHPQKLSAEPTRKLEPAGVKVVLGQRATNLQHLDIFIAKGIADVGDGMTIVAISRQNPWLIKTLKQALCGRANEASSPMRRGRMLRSCYLWAPGSGTVGS